MDSFDVSFSDDSLTILRAPEAPTINPSMMLMESQDRNYTQMKMTDKLGVGIADSRDYLDFFPFPVTFDEQFSTNTGLSDMGGTPIPLDDRLLFTRSSTEPVPKNTGPSKVRRRIGEKEWDENKTLILSLYDTTNLEKMMQTMEVDYNFTASKSAFKNHLKKWPTSRKNILKEYTVFMYKRMKQRMETEGKSTSFWYYGKEVPVGKIERAGADHNGTVSIRSTTPSNLSIITPRDSSCDHTNSKKRSVEEDHLDATVLGGNLPRKKERLVDIHQEEPHASLSDYIPPIGISLKERIDMHAYTQNALYEELSLMSSVDLCKLSLGYDTRQHHWGNDMILENILIKSEESLQTDVGPSRSNIDTSRYKIAHVKSMISQRRFHTAKMVLDGLQVQRDCLTTTPQLQLQLLKLALLVDIDDNILAPRSLDLIEAKCLSLIARQDATVCKNDRYWPTNLVLAYLFRLHGICERPLQVSTVKKMQTVLEDQFASGEKPSQSLIWAAHQYIRWCLRDMKHEEAGRTLENVARVVKIITGSPEALLTDALSWIREECRCNHGKPQTPPELVDIYERTAVDVQWEKAFRGYLWNEPCPTMSNNYPARRKDHDKDYWR
ncbi:hypothetical protein MMC17_000803 [Xylographa soralifera]|nr:hypothetical protein [Xylographa soralifera]